MCFEIHNEEHGLDINKYMLDGPIRQADTPHLDAEFRMRKFDVHVSCRFPHSETRASSVSALYGSQGVPRTSLNKP